MDELLMRRRIMNQFRDEYIVFEDAEAERVCVSTWGDGVGLTKRDAAKVTETQFRTVFVNNTTIVNFDEFKYFTGITAMTGNASHWFSGCTALKKLSLPDKLVTLNNNNVTGGIFKNCTSLEEITFPETLTRIGSNTFYHSKVNPFSTKLSKVHIKNLSQYLNITMSNTGASPFYASTASSRGLYINDTLVTDLVIPEGRTSIGGYTLRNNNTLTSVTIPSSFESTPSSSFYGVNKISRINISDLEKFCNITWAYPATTNNAGHPFTNNSAGGKLYLNGVEVTSLTIPSTITAIKDGAFYRTKLSSLTLHNSITSIGDSAFTGSGIDGTLLIPSSVTSIGAGTFGWNNFTEVTIPSSVTSIGNEAFNNCIQLVNYYDYHANANFRNLAYYTGTKVGKGTGRLYFDQDVTCPGATQGSLYFKQYVINGNLTATGSINVYNPKDVTGSTKMPIEEFRVNGNITFTGSGTTVLNINNNLISGTDLSFVELLGTAAINKPLLNIPWNFFKNGAIWHLGYNGVATNPTFVCASTGNISKIYVGDGSSQAADQAVLDQYLADSSWAQYASKLDLWYNYTGTYKD